jgi:hypothetical protein
MTCSASPNVFCDWLDVTFAPSDAPYPELNRLLLDAGFDVESTDRSLFVYSHQTAAQGKLVMGSTRGTFRVSASGAICAALRRMALWNDYLSILGTSPHKVTRLDAALDLAIDGADLVQLMRDRYPSGEVNLRRKAVRTSVILEVRPDGRESGSWYAGRRSRARFTARVYDKALEALSKRHEVLPPTARIEVTAAGSDAGATLRDAAQPHALFWHVAAPAIVTAPEDAPVWTPNTDCHWVTPTRTFDPAVILRRRVESLAILDALAIIADELGPEGRHYLQHLVTSRIDAAAPLPDTAPSIPATSAA